MSDWRDGYDDWKLRSPDWDDDPCAEVRAECARDINELCDKVDELRELLKTVLTEVFPDPVAEAQWRADAYRAIGIPDPNAPVEEEIAF